jgi:sugar transferase (PEP-CTERM/EpsH1 system associated)
MNILYVTPYVPSLIRTRPYNLIRALVGLGHQVTLLTAASTLPEEQAQAQELRDLGVKTEVFPVSRMRSMANCLQALPTREPFQAAYAYHPGMERRLGELLQKETFDVAHVEHLRASRVVRTALDSARGKRVPAVYDSVDCISLLFEQAAQDGAQWRSRMMTAIDLKRTRRYEAHLLTRYDQIVVTSQRDRVALERLARQYLDRDAQPAPITVITNGVDLGYFRPRRDVAPRGERTVVFTGKMSYHANIAAVLYFVHQVLPGIWAQDPGVRFQVVGKDPPEAVKRLAADERIQVTGTVDDIRPYLAQATVAVCPALYAVGVQNKVLEAMAMGTPVVSTPAGCGALTAKAGEEILVAEGEAASTEAILRVLGDADFAARLSAAGREYVKNHHSWESRAQELAALYEAARA